MEPYMGQIMQVGFSFAPRGWALCWGQIIGIAQNSALFSLLGTTFGGNGQTTFGLPDARGRVFTGVGSGPGLPPVVLGEIGGTPNTTLTINNMPAHNHVAAFTGTVGTLGAQVQAKSGIAQAQLSDTPSAGCFLANTADPEVSGTPLIYAPASSAGTAVNIGGSSVTGAPGGTVTIGSTGGSLPFSIQQPYLGITTIIATEGIFPSRN
jgi:microcystin-dependent protein